ncbi:hypothetical protein AB3S75_014704 [Citrus x aurantiifolia]
MSRHLVTEFLEQVYLVRVWYPREREQEQEYPTHPRGPSAVGSIKTFLLRVESRRPSQRQFARRALQSENQGTKAMQPPTTTEMGHPLSRAIRFVASVPRTFISDLSVGEFTPGKQPACSDLFLWTQEYLGKKTYE